MAKTTKMKLLELMVLKEDVSAVIEYIGKRESFQFQSKENQKKKSDGESWEVTHDDGISQAEKIELQKLL